MLARAKAWPRIVMKWSLELVKVGDRVPMEVARVCFEAKIWMVFV